MKKIKYIEIKKLKKKNNSTKLLFALFEIYEKLENESKKMYSFLSKFLQEESHSFGFKPFSNINSYILSELNKIYETDSFEYVFYELNTGKQNSKTKYYLVSKQIDITIDKENELLELYINILQKLSKDDLKIGKEFSLLITDLKDDLAFHSLLPFNDMIHYMLNKIEIEIYPEINYIDTEGWKNYGGWFYWFCIENEYGKRNLSVEYNNMITNIGTIDKFIKFIKNLK